MNRSWLKAMLWSVLVASGFSAGAAVAGPIFATEVLSTSCTTNCPGAGSGREDPASALFAPDGTFYSLGLGGEAVFAFGETFSSGMLNLFEVTFGNPANFLEQVDVYAGLEGVYTSVGSILNVDAQSGMALAIDIAFDSIRLVDSTALICSGNSCNGDGFDVDALSIDGIVQVPVPATLGLFALGFAVLSLTRRR